jgi:hypothetical protein
VDERTWSLLVSVQQFLDETVEQVRQSAGQHGDPVRQVIEEHLGTDPRGLPIVQLDVEAHQFVNLDVAMTAIIEQHGGGRVVGIGGGLQRHHQTLGDFMQGFGPWQGLPTGPVERALLDTGPSSRIEAVAYGLHLFRYHGSPVAVLQRRGSPQFGTQAGLEVVAAVDVAGPLLDDVRRVMVQRSVFRGQVIGFGQSENAYGPNVGGISFLDRPELAADQVVLPDGALERVERHVAGTARHRDALRAAGQHLKRGLLLYGPPGTGKTHTVRYLLSRLPGVTVVVLAGNALGFVKSAAELAHALEPAVVVLEDIDLIAEHRELHANPQPLLFTLLDAMDGLASEADVAFVLTTNRPDLLEHALAQRPGRVDLAVEVPLPDDAARLRLVRLYARGLPLSDQALDTAAERAQGATASFFKELFRRTVLLAAESGSPVTDESLTFALDEMLDDRERLTRALLGSGDGDRPPGPGLGVPMPFPSWGPGGP